MIERTLSAGEMDVFEMLVSTKKIPRKRRLEAFMFVIDNAYIDGSEDYKAFYIDTLMKAEKRAKSSDVKKAIKSLLKRIV